MKNKIVIRNEKKSDFDLVEKMIREAFWNLYVPGCSEHYLAHVMRSHEDYIPELSFVIELDNKIIGNVMYTKSKLRDEFGKEKEILTFGPVCILPEYQRLGYGSQLLKHSFEQARLLSYDLIVIFGSPSNYIHLDFVSCKKHNICVEGGKFPTAMLVKELKATNLENKKWFYQGSPAMEINESDAQLFDERFEPKEKKVQPSQEEFYIYSHSFLD